MNLTLFTALLDEVRQVGPRVNLSARTGPSNASPAGPPVKSSPRPTTSPTSTKSTPAPAPARQTYEEYVAECNKRIAAAPREFTEGRRGQSAYPKVRSKAEAVKPIKSIRGKGRTFEQVQRIMAARKADKEEKEEKEEKAVTRDVGDTDAGALGYMEDFEITADINPSEIGAAHETEANNDDACSEDSLDSLFEDRAPAIMPIVRPAGGQKRSLDEGPDVVEAKTVEAKTVKAKVHPIKRPRLGDPVAESPEGDPIQPRKRAPLKVRLGAARKPTM